MGSTILLSPTERQLAEKLSDIAITSSLPEERGADVLIYSKHGLFGIQRKEVPHDFVSSMYDGRMARETALLRKYCQFSRVVCEGRFRYYPDTSLVMDKHTPSRLKRSQIRGMLLDISVIQGIQVDYTEDIDDTVSYIKAVVEFVREDKHLGLFRRPSAQGMWIKPSAEDTQLWLLQSFPGVGPALADAIVKKFSGVPLTWTCSLEELQSVPRLGKNTAKEMYEALRGSTGSTILARLQRLKNA